MLCASLCLNTLQRYDMAAPWFDHFSPLAFTFIHLYPKSTTYPPFTPYLHKENRTGIYM